MSAKLQDKTSWLEGYECHPATPSALIWIRRLSPRELSAWQERFDVLKDDPVAARCGNTLRQLLSNEHVPDTELLGLAWMMRHILPAPG